MNSFHTLTHRCVSRETQAPAAWLVYLGFREKTALQGRRYSPPRGQQFMAIFLNQIHDNALQNLKYHCDDYNVSKEPS